MAPSPAQQAALKAQEGWLPEAKLLFQSALGLQLKTRSKSWQPVAEELWRFLLYSEFVFDLPCPLPAALADVPCAPDAARPLVEDLCERLRSDRRIDSLYIERAEAIELALALPTVCRELTDLGVRDTFPFEERSFFGQAIAALQSDAIERVRPLLERRSIWSLSMTPAEQVL